MTSRRIAIWWRFLLAAGLLLGASAAAAATGTESANAAQRTFTPAHTHVVSVAASTAVPGTGVHHARHTHRVAPMLAGVASAALALVVLLVSAAVRRHRRSQLLGDIRHWWSSRAPPERTNLLVLFGHASGRAGRFTRSRRALFSGTIPVHC